MKYNHLRLLHELMNQGKSQRKIVEYFQGEGYSESEILGEINSYEQEQRASAELKALPNEEFTMESAPENIPKKSTIPAQILLVLLAVVMFILLGVVLYFVL